MADNQLFPRRNAQEGVKVAALGVRFGGTALANSNAAPKFIHLDGIGGDIANRPVMEAGAGGPGFRKHPQDRVGVAIG